MMFSISDLISVGISHEIIRKLIDNKNPKHRSINNAEIKRAERVKAIETDPSIIINGREYGSLTREQQAKWIYSHGDGSQWDHTDYYKKRTPNNNKRNLEKTLEWRITHDPTATITIKEYQSLTPEQQAKFDYVNMIDQSSGKKIASNSYYKRKMPAAPALTAPAPANWDPFAATAPAESPSATWDPFAGGKRKTRKLRNKLKK